VGEIIRIVRQLEGTADPASEPDGSEIGLKVVRPIWIEMQREMMRRLDDMTIEQLCERARDQDIPRDLPHGPDFSI
jgi:DNA-binding IscR family transcriptional regulator